MNETTHHAMRTYGGSFIAALVALWDAADPINRARIEHEFAPEIKKYAAFGIDAEVQS